MACSGNLFLATILDYHKNLLTISQFGIPDFMKIFILTLREKTVNQFEHAFKNKTMPIQLYNSFNAIFFGYFNKELNKNIPRPNIDNFFKILKSFFNESYTPSCKEWLIAFYLAYSLALNRNLNNRIAPAILFPTHPYTFATQLSNDEFSINLENYGHHKLNYALSKTFKYTYKVQIIRNPIQAYCSMCSKYFAEGLEYNYINLITSFIFLCILKFKHDKRFFKNFVVKFEDLKIHPKNTLISLCKYIDLEWDNNLLTCSDNGYEFVGLSNAKKL